VVLLAKPGDRVTAGAPLVELHTDEPDRFARALEALEPGIEIGTEFTPTPLVIDRIR
jgi:thymidine phosphorylase